MSKDKNKKTTRYLHLHRVPFILLWMATYAMGWATAILGVLAFALIASAFTPDIWSLLIDNVYLAGGTIGLLVGIGTAFGQPWLVHQRSGMVLRFWRPLMIISYVFAGIGLAPLIDEFFITFNGSLNSITMAHFLWFFIPALLPMLSLRRVVRGAWQWGLALTSVATITAIAYPLTMIPATWHHPFAMLFGTLAQSFLTGWVMLRMLNHSRVDAQLNATVAQSNETSIATQEESTRGYLHATPYMLLWLMTQGVGWMFVLLVLLLLMLVTIIFPDMNYLLNNLHPMVFFGGAGLIYGIFSGWAQPWLMRLRTGKSVVNWRALTIIGSTLALLPFGYLVNAEYSNGPFEASSLTALSLAIAAWFVVPTLFQTASLRRVGRNIWLWSLASVTSAAITVMLFNQIMRSLGVSQYEYTSTAFLVLFFGQVVHVLVSGLTSLQILEAPEENADETDTTAAEANLSDNSADKPITDLLLTAQTETAQRRLRTNE